MEQTGGAQPTKQTKKVIVFKKQKSKTKEMKKKRSYYDCNASFKKSLKIFKFLIKNRNL